MSFIDQDLFQFDTSKNVLHVETEDFGKFGSYNLTLLARFDDENYIDNTGSYDFTINVLLDEFPYTVEE